MEMRLPQIPIITPNRAVSPATQRDRGHIPAVEKAVCFIGVQNPDDGIVTGQNHSNRDDGTQQPDQGPFDEEGPRINQLLAPTSRMISISRRRAKMVSLIVLEMRKAASTANPNPKMKTTLRIRLDISRMLRETPPPKSALSTWFG